MGAERHLSHSRGSGPGVRSAHSLCSVNGLVLNEAGTGNAVALDAGRPSSLSDRMESLGSTRLVGVTLQTDFLLVSKISFQTLGFSELEHYQQDQDRVRQ